MLAHQNTIMYIAVNVGIGYKLSRYTSVLTSIGKGFVTKTVEVALSTKLKEHDYLLLNTTYINLDGKEKLLSVGMFGHVFTFDKDMLRENLEEAMKDKEE
jgi:hypothetical protein